MKTKRLAEFLMLAAAPFLSHQAKAQLGCSGYPADCDTYVEYDVENNEVWGYSYTWDYWYLGWWGTSVSVDFSTPWGTELQSSDSNYEYADVYFFFASSDGYYNAAATHYIDFNVAGYTSYWTWADQPLPTGETTTPAGWDSGGYGLFNMTLTGANTTWAGASVREVDPGGGGPDDCYWSQSAYDPFESVTGAPPGGWPVGSGNAWSTDYIGYGNVLITYYRSQGRTPCGTQFYQQMQILKSGSEVWQDYVLNLLQAYIGFTEEWSTRAGVTQGSY